MRRMPGCCTKCPNCDRELGFFRKQLMVGIAQPCPHCSRWIGIPLKYVLLEKGLFIGFVALGVLSRDPVALFVLGTVGLVGATLLRWCVTPVVKR